MWIALTEGWLSIVAHHDKPDHLLVRARNPKHITRIRRAGRTLTPTLTIRSVPMCHGVQ